MMLIVELEFVTNYYIAHSIHTKNMILSYIVKVPTINNANNLYGYYNS